MTLKTFCVKEEKGLWTAMMITVDDNGNEKRTDTVMRVLNDNADLNKSAISEISKEISKHEKAYSEDWLKIEISTYLKIGV